MTIKATVQHNIEDALKASDLIEAIVLFAKDPGYAKNIRDTLIEGHTVSEERRREAQEAATTITAAQNATAQLKKEKEDHEQRVMNIVARLDERQQGLVKVRDDLETEKARLKAETVAKIAELDARHEEVENNAKKVEARHNAADAREESLKALAEDLRKQQEKLAADQRAHEDKVAKFKAKRKLLEAATKEAQQED